MRRIVCEKIKDKRIDDKSGRSYDTRNSTRLVSRREYYFVSFVLEREKKERIINKPKRLNFLDKNLCNFLIFLSAISLSPTLFKKATWRIACRECFHILSFVFQVGGKESGILYEERNDVREENLAECT